MVRYSFLVRLFHPLLHAGLSRRTNILIALLDLHRRILNECKRLRQLASERLNEGFPRYSSLFLDLLTFGEFSLQTRGTVYRNNLM